MPISMQRGFSAAYRAGLFAIACMTAASAFSAPLSLTYDTFVETKAVGSQLTSSSPIHIEGSPRNLALTGSAITDTLTFRAGSTSASLSAGWLIGPPSNRTVGVNIDIIDAFNNVVATDTFLGVAGDLASSQLIATGLIPGAQYRVVITGTAVGVLGRYQIDLVDGSVPPPVPVPSAVAVPSANGFVFDTHTGTKNLGSVFATGAQVQIDGVIADDLNSAINNQLDFTFTGNTLSAGITWIVEAGSAQRTTGVNVDVFNSSNVLVATDFFMGVIDGQAFSQFTASLLPGNYHLLFTGIAPLGGRYHIDLTTNATPPGFKPIDTQPQGVPEPTSAALLVMGFLGLAASQALRSRRARATLPLRQT